ncbi:TIR domain-containing protein [Sphingomonas glacialis]|uniref:TIR domain-containing protein n=1 Tax=Sphingomonas glacialis TaxID=658225 RepID=A0A502FAW6_9SPHN|nr:TIR domain-containing protein [Sphingomonas glacialis]TPG46454.1 TIR domain-containing protein [Sphingomonas glacialis]
MATRGEPNGPGGHERDNELMGKTFLSYATADRREAAAICAALETRGFPCWMAARDVAPGDNYQEAIVGAIRAAGALVLVFSENANRSDEIKKELSLASRFRVPVITVRIADVDASDAFAYELSTRQWIDLFPDRAHALDTVARRLDEHGTIDRAEAQPDTGTARRTHTRLRRLWIGGGLALLALAGGGAWLATHRGTGSGSSAVTVLAVRLTGFERLTPDIPAGTDAALRDELTAALADEGVVKVSNAGAPVPGDSPALGLSGTMRRDDAQVRVVLRLFNERSGANLWSQSYAYDAGALSRMPRLVAANAGSVLRCGLFGASTYPRALPDGAMADYLTECYHHYSLDAQLAKGLDAARRVVAAVPDFSWGWSGIAISAMMTSASLSPLDAAPYIRESLAATDRAIALDPTNSEALAWKSLAIDPAALTEREALLRQALQVRALSCGCEHNIYGAFLAETGRSSAALAQYRRAVDTLALEFDSQEALAIALAEGGNLRGAKDHVDAAVELTGDPGQRAVVTLILAPVSRDFGGAIAMLDQPPLPYGKAVLAAWRVALQALAAGVRGDRATAVAALVALPDAGQEATITVSLLGALGANREAMALIERRAAAREWGIRSLLFVPSLAGARNDPAFAAVTDRLGLMRYWRATKTRPDVCAQSAPPAFCQTI